jgi:hypothetical protein
MKFKSRVLWGRKRTRNEKWFRKQWNITQMREKKAAGRFFIHKFQRRDYNECDTQQVSVAVAGRCASTESKGGFA